MMGHGELATARWKEYEEDHCIPCSLLRPAGTDRRSRHGGTPRFVASASRTDHGDTCRWLLAPGKAAAALVELLAASGSGALNRHGRFKSHHDLVDQNR